MASRGADEGSYSQESTATSRREWVIALAVIACAAVCYWACRGTEGAGVPWIQTDLYAGYVPMMKYLVQSLKEGELPLWNPYQDVGSVFIAYPLGAFYPPSWLFFVLPTPVALHLFAILHLIAAGFFSYLFCRTLKLSLIPSLVGGLSFLFCGTVLSNASWSPIHIASTVWIPLAFVCLNRLFDQGSGRYVVGLAATCAVQVLAGFPQFSLYMYYGLAAYGLVLGVSKYRESSDWRLAAGLLGLCVGAMVLGTLAASVQLVPLRELAGKSLRLALGSEYRDALRGALRSPNTKSIKLFLEQQLLSSPNSVIVLGAALAGLFHRRRREAAFFGALVAVSVALAAGPGTWLYEKYSQLPTGNIFLHPDRLALLYHFGAAVLTAMGFDMLVHGTSCVSPCRGWRLASRPGKFVVYVAALALCVKLIPDVTIKAPWIWSAVLVAVVVCVRFLTDKRLPWRPVSFVLAVLLTWQLATWFVPLFTVQLDESMYDASRSTFSYLEQHQGMYRAMIVHQKRADFGFVHRLGHLRKVSVFGEYDPMQDRRLSRYVSCLNAGKPMELKHISTPQAVPGQSALRLLNLAGVRHLVVRRAENRSAISREWEHLAVEGDASGALRLRLVFEDPEVRIYENENAIPRAYFVPDLKLVTDEEEILRTLASSEFDARRCALVEDASLLARQRQRNTETKTPGREGSTWVAHYGSHEVLLTVVAPCDGFVVLTDLHYPGWRAEVDGTPVEIHRANYLFRMVEVGAGAHEVRFVYPGYTFFTGLAMSAAAVAGITVLWVVAGRRRAVS